MSPEEIASTRAVDTLQQRLKVIRQGTTFLVDINVNSESPTKAAEIANAIADAYFEEQVRSKYEATRIAAGWLSGQIENLKKRVTLSEKAVEDYRSSNNLTVSQGVTVNDQQMTDLNNKLIEARVQTAESRAKYDQMQQMAKSGGDPGLHQRGHFLRHHHQTAHAVCRNRQERRRPRRPLRRPASSGRQHPRAAPGYATADQRGGAAHSARAHVMTMTSRCRGKNRCRRASRSCKGVSNVSNQAQVQLHELRREAEANRTLYESYLARYKETSAQESLEMPDSRIVTRASIPISPSFPKTTLIVGLALALGLGIGCSAAFLADYLDRRIKTLDEAEQLARTAGSRRRAAGRCARPRATGEARPRGARTGTTRTPPGCCRRRCSRR